MNWMNSALNTAPEMVESLPITIPVRNVIDRKTLNVSKHERHGEGGDVTCPCKPR